MNPLESLRGIITVLNTPFTEDDAIDTVGLRKNVDYALEAGVAGFLVPAMAGEVDKLTEAERLLLVETVLDEVRGRAPVIGGASASSREARLATARRLIEAGCHGILVSIPFANEVDYEAAVREVAALEPGFLMIQDWDATGFGLSMPLIQHLFDTVDVFRCLKVEVVPAGPKYSQVLEATEGRLHVSGGWAVTQLIEALDRGVHAFMPTGMHRIYTCIYRLYVTGQRQAAQDLFHRIVPVLAFSNQHLDISIHFFKRLLHAQGIYATARVRLPILPFDPDHERMAAELIQRVLDIESEL